MMMMMMMVEVNRNAIRFPPIPDVVHASSVPFWRVIGEFLDPLPLLLHQCYFCSTLPSSNRRHSASTVWGSTGRMQSMPIRKYL